MKALGRGCIILAGSFIAWLAIVYVSGVLAVMAVLTVSVAVIDIIMED